MPEGAFYGQEATMPEGAFYGQEGRPQGSHPTKTYLKPVGVGLVPTLVRDGFISFGIKNIPEYWKT